VGTGLSLDWTVDWQWEVGGRHRETVVKPDVCVRVSSKFADCHYCCGILSLGSFPAQTLLWDTSLDDR